jgi:hypothetical protein
MTSLRDYAEAAQEARAFYGNAPRSIIVDAPCKSVAHLDMDGIGYRCSTCFAIVGSMGCGCTRDLP